MFRISSRANFTSYTFGQDVAVFYDAAVENGNGLSVPNPLQLAEMIVDELDKKKLTAEIVDSDELVEYMEANPQGIYIITQGNTPGTIFKNQGKKDLIHSWLREGGIGGFIGDYAFYYYWDKGARVTAAGAGQQSVFGATVTNGVRFQPLARRILARSICLPSKSGTQTGHQVSVF